MKNLIYLFGIVLIVLATGCSRVGVDFQKPKNTSIAKEWDNNSSTGVESLEWWKLFKDETLNALVKKAYNQNLDLRAASMRILQSRAALGITQGYQYPQIQQLKAAGAQNYQNSQSFTTLTSSFDLAWEMDVWGMYARGVETAQASLYASMASYDDIATSITAEVARNYIEYKVAQERIYYAKQNIEIQEKVLAMTQVQFNAGNVSELDMQQAKTQLYLTKSALPALEIQKIHNQNALAILLGETPKEIQKLLRATAKKEAHTPYVELNEGFEVSATELARRPDIQVAEYLAHAKSAQIGIAEAKLYPHFSLFGSIGVGATNQAGGWNSLADGVYVQAGPALTWDIFQYGRIENEIKLKDAAFEESLLLYNKKVLEAIGDVSNALNGYRYLHEQFELNKKATDATRRAYELSSTQYENGLVGYQRLLTSVEKLTKSEDVNVQIKGQMALNIVALYKALGGGWKIAHTQQKFFQKDKDALKSRGYWKGEELDE